MPGAAPMRVSRSDDRAGAREARAQQAEQECPRDGGERDQRAVAEDVDGAGRADRARGQRADEQRQQREARPQDRRHRAPLRRRGASPALREDHQHGADRDRRGDHRDHVERPHEVGVVAHVRERLRALRALEVVVVAPQQGAAPGRAWPAGSRPRPAADLSRGSRAARSGRRAACARAPRGRARRRGSPIVKPTLEFDAASRLRNHANEIAVISAPKRLSGRRHHA